MPTKQEIDSALFDSAVKHQIFVNRLASQYERELAEELSQADGETLQDIEKRLDGLKRGFSGGDRDKTNEESLLALIAAAYLTTYRSLGTRFANDLREFSEFESALARRRLAEAFDTAVAKGGDPALLRAIISEDPFQGKNLKEWFRDLRDSKVRRLRDEIRIGLVQGESTSQILARLKGTRAFRFRDGVLSVEERKLRAVVQTAVTHVSARAREIAFSQDSRIRGIRWISVLDSSTTIQCRNLSNRIFPVNSGPRPPIHIGCRSTISPIFSTTSTAPEPSYEEWLRKQPFEMQEDVLGKKKARLFRLGQLPLSKFSDRNFKEFTLRELREREEQAWMRAFPNT